MSLGDGCWNWTAAKIALGYGRFSLRGHGYSAHRLAYMQLVGPIPDGLELDHLCRNHSCVNPAHLEAVTHAVNLSRAQSTNPNFRKFKTAQAKKAQTHCIHGHEFTKANTWIENNGSRRCRRCHADRAYLRRRTA